MRTSTFALVIGIVYLAVAVLGLVPALLMPPPADASPTSFFASSWARAICSCISWACFMSAFMSSFTGTPPPRSR